MTSHALIDALTFFQEEQVVIQFLIADNGQFIVVLLQHFHGRRQDRSKEVGTCLQTGTIDIGIVCMLLCHGLEIAVNGIVAFVLLAAEPCIKGKDVNLGEVCKGIEHARGFNSFENDFVVLDGVRSQVFLLFRAFAVSKCVTAVSKMVSKTIPNDSKPFQFYPRNSK